MPDEIIYIDNPYNPDPDRVDISNHRLRQLYSDRLEIIKVYQQHPQHKDRCLQILQSIDYQREWILRLRSLIYDPMESLTYH